MIKYAEAEQCNLQGKSELADPILLKTAFSLLCKIADTGAY